MQNRAHPRHYRSEYVRGYQHRQADVYSLPGWLLQLFPMKYLLSREEGKMKSEERRMKNEEVEK